MVPAHKDVLSAKGRTSVQKLGDSLSQFLLRQPDPRTNVIVRHSESVRCVHTARVLAEKLYQCQSFHIDVKPVSGLKELPKWDYQSVTTTPSEDQLITQWIEATFDPSVDPSTAVIVVTHGNIARKGLHRFLGWPSNVQFGPATASMTVIDWNVTTNEKVVHVMGECCHTGPTSLTWKNQDLFTKPSTSL